MPSETLWTGFQNRKIAAERAVKDAKGRNIADNIDLISQKLYFAGNKTANEIKTDTTLRIQYAVYRLTSEGRTYDGFEDFRGWNFDGHLHLNDMVFWWTSGNQSNWMLLHRDYTKIKFDSDYDLSNATINSATGSIVFTHYSNSSTVIDEGPLYFLTNTTKSKLDGIDAGAEANVIEEVQANGTALPVSSKTVNIPLAAYDTTSNPTAYTDGLMTGEEKEKLSAVPATQLSLAGDGTYITASESSGTVTVALTVHTANYTITT